MNYRTFGRLGWQVGEVGYGMWGMAGWLGADEQSSIEGLREAARLGCNFFDTAYGYGEGRSELLLGDLVRATPDKKLYTATKIPPKNRSWPSRREFALDEVFPPEHIAEYAERSLSNLGVDRIDLLQFHVWEDSWARDERWMRAVESLKSQGMIAGVGISVNRWEPWNVLETIRTGQIDAVQVIYNIFDQAPEDELFPLCQEMNIAVIARVPFDEGTLTGTLTEDTTFPAGDWRNSYFVPENLRQSVARAEALKRVVPAGETLPGMALRFILQNPVVSTVIPGMRSTAHVRSNISVSGGEAMPPSLLKELRTHRWDREPTTWSQ